jgi:hypothetical protein
MAAQRAAGMKDAQPMPEIDPRIVTPRRGRKRQTN